MRSGSFRRRSSQRPCGSASRTTGSRGFLLPRSGIVLGAALFGFMHFAGIVHYMPPLTAMFLSLPTLVAGLAWGWMRRSSGSLWPCVVTHMAADAGILWLIGAIRAMP